MAWPVEARDQHLRQAHVFGPCDSPRQIVAQFLNVEMAADADHAVVAHDFAKLSARVFAHGSEFLVAYRRTKFDGLKTGTGKCLHSRREVLCDHCPNGICLAPYG